MHLIRLWTNSRIQEKEPERIEIEREGEKGRHRDRERKRETRTYHLWSNMQALEDCSRLIHSAEVNSPPKCSRLCSRCKETTGNETRTLHAWSFLSHGERKTIDMNHLQTQLTIESEGRTRRGPEVQGVQGWLFYYDKDDLVFPFNISAAVAKSLQSCPTLCDQ